jgi:hypothetical protein
MLPESQRPLDDETCPVSDQTLGDIYRASPHGLNELIAGVSPQARALLAVYCYRRAHLTSIGLAIAATCELDDLTGLGGNVGKGLFEQSREVPNAPLVDPHTATRRKITLATKQLCHTYPLQDDADN